MAMAWHDDVMKQRNGDGNGEKARHINEKRRQIWRLKA
jgi:hypothetical protein